MAKEPQDELEVWLGPALDEMTDEQVDRMRAESARIHERYPDPDEQDLRDAAMNSAVQYLLDETTIDDAGRALALARLEQDRAMAAAQQMAAMAVEDGMSEYQAAERACIDRMTVRKALGKR